jgi:hypothetical protein
VCKHTCTIRLVHFMVPCGIHLDSSFRRLYSYRQYLIGRHSVHEGICYRTIYVLILLIVICQYLYMLRAAYSLYGHLTRRCDDFLPGREAAVLTTGLRHLVGRVPFSASCAHLGLCKVLERHVVGDACEDVLDRAP